MSETFTFEITETMTYALKVNMPTGSTAVMPSIFKSTAALAGYNKHSAGSVGLVCRLIKIQHDPCWCLASHATCDGRNSTRLPVQYFNSIRLNAPDSSHIIRSGIPAPIEFSILVSDNFLGDLCAASFTCL